MSEDTERAHALTRIYEKQQAMTAPRQPATPTPWKVHLGDWDGPKILADDAGECLIATVEPENTIPEHAEADARYIVHAVNSLDALVQELEEALGIQKRWYETLSTPDKALGHGAVVIQPTIAALTRALGLARGTEG